MSSTWFEQLVVCALLALVVVVAVLCCISWLVKRSIKYRNCNFLSCRLWAFAVAETSVGVEKSSRVDCSLEAAPLRGASPSESEEEENNEENKPKQTTKTETTKKKTPKNQTKTQKKPRTDQTKRHRSKIPKKQNKTLRFFLFPLL